MSKRKNPAAVGLGRKGGKARWKGKTAVERSRHARRMNEARWGKGEQNNGKA